MNALSRLCLRRLGYDPSLLSPADLEKRMPDIIGAVVDASAELSERIEMSKSVAQRVGRFIPNPGIVREESCSGFADSPAELANDCLTSLIPF